MKPTMNVVNMQIVKMICGSDVTNSALCVNLPKFLSSYHFFS